MKKITMKKITMKIIKKNKKNNHYTCVTYNNYTVGRPGRLI